MQAGRSRRWPLFRSQWQCGAPSSARATFSSPSPSPSPRSYPRSSPAPVNVQEMKNRRAKIIRDYLTPMPSHLLTITLSDLLKAPPPSSSSMLASSERAVPQAHHLVYFPLQTPASGLAFDGADRDHAPNEEFTKRLWAGGEVRFRDKGLVLDGGAWVCREEVGDVRVKGGGRDGEKVFVDVWRRYGLGHEAEERGPGEWDIEERRTLVFMRKTGADQGPSRAARLVKYPHPPTHSVSLLPTPTHLFHFSALTYNAHSIHIDPLYAKSQDGHRALLVHGPLSLALMLRVLNDHVAPGANAEMGGAVKSVVYRNHAPLYAGERMKVCVRRARREEAKEEEEWDVWVEGPEGGMAVKGSVVVDARKMGS
ncbi:Thioesterase/thiol ester dehydrase-isomerase [Trichoderma ceciliae]